MVNPPCKLAHSMPVHFETRFSNLPYINEIIERVWVKSMHVFVTNFCLLHILKGFPKLRMMYLQLNHPCVQLLTLSVFIASHLFDIEVLGPFIYTRFQINFLLPSHKHTSDLHPAL